MSEGRGFPPSPAKGDAEKKAVDAGFHPHHLDIGNSIDLDVTGDAESENGSVRAETEKELGLSPFSDPSEYGLVS